MFIARERLAQSHSPPYPVRDKSPKEGDDAPTSVNNADMTTVVDGFYYALCHLFCGH
jgi:hypothetical protein